MHPETREVVNESEAAARFTFWSTIIVFTCSYLITAVHLIVLGAAIIVRVTSVTREAITTHGNPQAIAYQRIVTYRILVLFSAFIVCHTPFWIMAILQEIPSYINAVNKASPHYPAIMNGAAYLMTANSVVNPLLYAAVNDDFKLAFRSSINRLRRWFYNPKLFFWNVFQSSTMQDDVRLTQSMLLTTPQPPPQSLVED
ncbi:Oidioi.mRNA.OKI2018_I69.XSR.g14376.t1.cds [Oikopleura dioica]|uniref:Oidioi.mRNA.OKI2018_I69.XSR.g14376.t1.cds n=1 Tax=Oikopleura dioica TaxID=34765 RepID=A0ABN7SGV2_OIKDI|nr:Oidioi.mRNA.OKI2018_I69.XSR.g14376.t1.cds [Oikopleura dioica]